MAVAALWAGWCHCPQRYFGSGVHLLSSHNLGPRGELTLSKSYSSGNRRGFLSSLLNNIKEELAKNKEMKQKSDAFQEARRKYKTTELKTQATRRHWGSCYTRTPSDTSSGRTSGTTMCVQSVLRDENEI
uniref:Uncharacterized protein n=1 Tax=Capra hircus TaxID=9925 RepID=A0A8C2PJ13_CAPHI